MREPKNQMLGTMEPAPPLMQLSVKGRPKNIKTAKIERKTKPKTMEKTNEH